MAKTPAFKLQISSSHIVVSHALMHSTFTLSWVHLLQHGLNHGYSDPMMSLFPLYRLGKKLNTLLM